MISVEQAIQKIQDAYVLGNNVSIAVSEAVGYVLSKNVFAPIHVPPFNQSAMDGYAFRFEDVNEPLNISDEIPAGDIRSIEIKQGEAVRIFTGAMVPSSCDTVVMQELTAVKDGILQVKDDKLKLGGNIRTKGHQIEQGEVALEKGTRLTPAGIGFLSSLGISEVEVYAKPRLTILATGDELIQPGNQLKPGQIYESNTKMLVAALEAMSLTASIGFVSDDLEQTKTTISNALNDSDVLLISGGISVGDYDYVRPSLLDNGVVEVFYKVNQKPGKPLFFGKSKNKLVFALPGNPAAALNCFYIYVYGALGAFMGAQSPALESAKFVLNGNHKKKVGRAEFVKVNVKNGLVKVLEGQGSDVLKSFAQANGLAFFDADIAVVNSGEQVNVFLLPQ